MKVITCRVLGAAMTVITHLFADSSGGQEPHVGLMGLNPCVAGWLLFEASGENHLQPFPASRGAASWACGSFLHRQHLSDSSVVRAPLTTAGKGLCFQGPPLVHWVHPDLFTNPLPSARSCCHVRLHIHRSQGWDVGVSGAMIPLTTRPSWPPLKMPLKTHLVCLPPRPVTCQEIPQHWPWGWKGVPGPLGPSGSCVPLK